MTNWLKQLIDNRFLDRPINWYLDKSHSLHELRTLYAIGPRQTGATTCIAEIFDVEQDIYFGNNPAMCAYFKKKVDNPKVKYSYLNQKSHDNIRGLRYNIRYIFIDISCIQLGDKKILGKIDEFIKFCELNFKEPKYIIT